jgi:hypothetical protein
METQWSEPVVYAPVSDQPETGAHVAQKIRTLLIDGSEAEGTVRFALDGAEYEIDLSTARNTEPRQSLENYIAHARNLTWLKLVLIATQAEALRQVQTPALIVVGNQDHAHASAEALAAVLPDARFTRVPGDHWSALTGPELATAITAFLRSRPQELDPQASPADLPWRGFPGPAGHWPASRAGWLQRCGRSGSVSLLSWPSWGRPVGPAFGK